MEAHNRNAVTPQGVEQKKAMITGITGQKVRIQ
jgi:hypothetical protein